MIFTGTNYLMGGATGSYDGHAHVFSTSLPMMAGRRYTPGYDATPKQFADILKSHGLDGALLVQPSFLGTDNSYLLTALEDYSASRICRFRGVVVLDPACPPDYRELCRMQALGVTGIRLNLVRQSTDFRYEDWQSLLSRTEGLGWHVELHCEAEHLPRLLPGLISHHAQVVVDHFGLINPDRSTDLAGLSCLLSQPVDQLRVKISGAYRIYPAISNGMETAKKIEPLLTRYVEHFGPERLAWGSDWPFTQNEHWVSYPDTLLFKTPKFMVNQSGA